MLFNAYFYLEFHGESNDSILHGTSLKRFRNCSQSRLSNILMNLMSFQVWHKVRKPESNNVLKLEHFIVSFQICKFS